MEYQSFPLISRLSQALGKSIALLDCETTSLMGKGRVGIVELAILIFNPDGSMQSWQELINPGMSISWQATKIHGIHNKDVAYAPLFASFIAQIRPWLEQAIIAGFNSRSFDIPVIKSNIYFYLQEDVTISQQLDIRDLWVDKQKKRSGTLAVVAKNYNVRQGEAHRAMGDVLTTTRILEAMLWRHGVDFVLSHMKTTTDIAINHANTSIDSSSNHDHKTVIAPKISTTDIIQHIILEHINQHQNLLPEAYALIAKEAQQATATKVNVNNITFLLSSMLDSEKTSAESLSYPPTQALIAQHIERAMHIAGNDGRLKPLKTALDALTQSDIDYVQIKIALMQY